MKAAYIRNRLADLRQRLTWDEEALLKQQEILNNIKIRRDRCKEEIKILEEMQTGGKQ